MKITMRPSLVRLFRYLFLALLLVSFSLHARVVDDFNGASLSGWSAPYPGGTLTQSAGQATFALPVAPNASAFSKKTVETFTNAATHTLEFRVLVNSVFTNGVTTNGMALLGWVPTAGIPTTAGGGYFLAVGPNRIQVWANAAPLYVTNLVTSIQSSNIYLQIRMTPSGASMLVKSTVYKKADGFMNVLFEYTATNSANTLIGTAGQVFLGAGNDATATPTSVSYDDLQVFDTTREVLDDFSGVYPAGWSDHVSGVATNSNNGSGQLQMIGGTLANQVSGTFKADRTFKITDGVRLELRIDVANVAGDAGNFTILDYSPHGDADFAGLQSYHIAFSSAQFYVGKAYGVWWDGGRNLGVLQSNVRMIQTLTGEGTAVRIESRVEDLSVDVNDPLRVLYQFTRLDTSSSYQNFDGYFAVGNFHAGGGQSTITMDNAEVNKSNTGNTPPLISGQSPADGKNFYTAAGGVSFNVADDVSVPRNNVKLILNGITYTNGSPGVTVLPTNASSISRSFTFTNLVPDTFYSGSIVASDNLNLASTAHYEFDTFLTNNIQVESEDFNYSGNVGVDGGLFFDIGLRAYSGLQGSPEIDYHDSRTGGNGDNPEHYRDLDFPRTYPTGDPSRSQYVAAGQSELLVYDNRNNDWRNYTRTFAAGTYKVYSRQSSFAIPTSLVSLSKVTSDPHTNNQTTAGLGAFLQLGDSAGDTGYDQHRNVQLTDAVGTPAVVRLAAGQNTLRVTEINVDGQDSEVFHNYLVLVPTADPGTLRPILTQTSPLPGATLRQGNASTERTFAAIANRDTTVNVGTVALQINGVSIPSAVVTTVTGGAEIEWTLANVPASRIITNTVTYQDSAGTNLTYSWTYSYPFLSATNRLPVGSLPTRGFAHRTAQDDLASGDTLSRAEDQLAIPPVIVSAKNWATNVDVLNWNDNTGVPSYVPGLDGGISGYPAGPYNYIATEDLAYLSLKKGGNRFQALSDDGFQLRSGTNTTDTGATVLGVSDGNTFYGSFDFVVEADGLYPVRNLWYEQGGSANFALSAYNFATSTYNVVNDPANPAGVVKAYLAGIPTLLLSSATVNGTYTSLPGAVIDIPTKTITVATSGSTRFYRIQSASVVTITSISVVGSNVVITYL